MIQTYKTKEDIDNKKWNDLIQHSSRSSFFQSPECYDFLTSLSFLEPFVFGVSEDLVLKGVVSGYIIADGGKVKQYFSRRAIIIGGILQSDDISEQALLALLKLMKGELTGKAIYIEIRNFSDYSSSKHVFEKSGFLYQPHLNFHISTVDLESSLKQLNTTKRRDVKKSKTEGATIEELEFPEDIQEFYNILDQLYRIKVKTSLFPYEFFEKLSRLPHGKVFGIRYNNHIIGGSACVGLEGKAVYEWFVCGEDGKYKNIFPSTLATWADIEYSAINGYDYLDMMGAGKPNEGYGVRDFKSKFGGQLVEHGRFLYVSNPFLYNLGKKVIEILKKRK